MSRERHFTGEHLGGDETTVRASIQNQETEDDRHEQMIRIPPFDKGGSKSLNLMAVTLSRWSFNLIQR